MKRTTLIISLILLILAGCKKHKSTKFVLKTFPITLQKQLKIEPLKGKITLKRSKAKSGLVVYHLKINKISKQKGKLMPMIQTEVIEEFDLISKESTDEKGNVIADLTIKDPKIITDPPLPKIKEEMLNLLKNFKCTIRLAPDGKVLSVDPRGETSPKAANHITDMIFITSLLPDKPIGMNETYTSRTNRVKHLAASGILPIKRVYSYTVKGITTIDSKKGIVIQLNLSAKGHTTKNKITDIDLEGKGNGLVVMEKDDGTLLKAEVHLVHIANGWVQSGKKKMDFSQYYETHIHIDRKQ